MIYGSKDVKWIYALYDSLSRPSNYPVFIVGSDWLCTKQFIPPVIDPLIGMGPIVVKGPGSIDRQEEMQA